MCCYLICVLVIDWSDAKGVCIFSIPSEVEYARNHGVIQIGENVCRVSHKTFSHYSWVLQLPVAEVL